jgi:hypothetical protein
VADDLTLPEPQGLLNGGVRAFLQAIGLPISTDPEKGHPGSARKKISHFYCGFFALVRLLL